MTIGRHDNGSPISEGGRSIILGSKKQQNCGQWTELKREKIRAENQENIPDGNFFLGCTN